jgi:hypothetical protein
MILASDQPLYVHTLGRAIRVTAIFQSADEANGFMAAKPGQGVLACYSPFRYLALMSNIGFKIEM